MIHILRRCAAAGLLLCACNGTQAAVVATREQEAAAGLVLYRAGPGEGLVGELASNGGRISFEVRRCGSSDRVTGANPVGKNCGLARIRDSRGVTIWGVGSGQERPSPDEEARKSAVTAPPSTADLELVKMLPDVLREGGVDPAVFELELEALDGAAAAFRGVDGPGGPAPRPPMGSREGTR